MNVYRQTLLIAMAAVVLIACGKQEPPSGLAPSAPVQSPPPLPVNAPIVAGGATSTAEIYVTDSVPVLPGTLVAIIDASGPTLLVARAAPFNVRWKLRGPFSAPSFPAEGFVAFSLSASEWQAIQKADSLRIQPVSNAQ
jgi:hypothetical protein